MKKIELNRIDDQYFQVVIEEHFMGALYRNSKIVSREKAEVFEKLKEMDQFLSKLLSKYYRE